MRKEEQRHRYRENIEALTMAVAIALLFKSFILEISKIPSGSMQPTLMGNAESAIFDRVLVDKLSFHYRDPERFEIVVFRHPLERSRVMVKRVVGMPSEELKVEEGDLWVRSGPEDEWAVLRRPPAVQEKMWKRIDSGAGKNADWGLVRGGREWRLAGRDVRARGDGSVRFREGRGPVADGYTDGYPPSIAREISSRYPGEHPVGDLRLEGRIVTLAGTERIAVEMTEGPRVYEFALPGPAADANASPTVRIQSPDAPAERTEEAEPWKLPAGRAVRFAVENLDDRLALEIDGETVMAVEIEASRRQEAFITLSLTGEGAELEDLRVYRDIFYLPADKGTFSIPAGHYVMLGDNTQDSADSRDWKAVSFEWSEEDGKKEGRGNHRPGARLDDAPNPIYASLEGGTSWTRFRDLWGEVHWFPKADGREVGWGPAPLVPRELIQGRAVAVFWPLKPWRGLWRLGWLH